MASPTGGLQRWSRLPSARWFRLSTSSSTRAAPYRAPCTSRTEQLPSPTRTSGPTAPSAAGDGAERAPTARTPSWAWPRATTESRPRPGSRALQASSTTARRIGTRPRLWPSPRAQRRPASTSPWRPGAQYPAPSTWPMERHRWPTPTCGRIPMCVAPAVMEPVRTLTAPIRSRGWELATTAFRHARRSRAWLESSTMTPPTGRWPRK